MNNLRPTCRLRFVQRELLSAFPMQYRHVLQQWWESPGAPGPAGVSQTTGEWRDVELISNEADS